MGTAEVLTGSSVLEAGGVDRVGVVTLSSSFSGSWSDQGVGQALRLIGREGTVTVDDGTGETTVVLGDSEGREREKGSDSDSRTHFDGRE